ncbi:hypothetical protein EVAR_57283_1 [Eumeta japonica]|uniref:Uncharacterized protein n=1 Tax=Eumeta variegata TaxID=151549 RepID=A0A4C2A154_EUMVA|nr:hypothetical protein EVAR_57283_1 [Eumeta japonica]
MCTCTLPRTHPHAHTRTNTHTRTHTHSHERTRAHEHARTCTFTQTHARSHAHLLLHINFADENCFLIGTYEVKGKDENEEAQNQNIKVDRKAKSELILAISSTELRHVRGCGTSCEVWVKLMSVYALKGPARKALLLKQLMLHKVLMMEPEGKHRNSIMKQRILAVFGLVEIVLRCTLTTNDFQGLMMQPEGSDNGAGSLEAPSSDPESQS